MLKKSLALLAVNLLLLLVNTTALAAEEGEEKAMDLKPAYVSLGKPMVLNLDTGNKRQTYLQLKADVLVKGENAKMIVEAHIPAIRHKLIVILSEQKAKDMKTPSKREEIRQQVTAQIKAMMEEMADTRDIEELLFSKFLVQ